MKTLIVVGTIVLALSLLFNMPAQAGNAQQPNPLFLKAGALSQQLSSSSLNNNAKAAWRQRFEALKQEQEYLWYLAGQVDNGQCNGSCIDLYNSRVLNWQSRLQQFNDDASLALRPQRLDPASLRKCLADCDREEASCWKVCQEGRIEESQSCHMTCHDTEIRCSNSCYGIQ